MSVATRLIATATVLVLALLALVGCYDSAPTDSPGDRLHATVPDLVGMSQDTAEDALTEAGYALGEVTEDVAEGASPGTVVSQSPIWGTSLPRDGTVDIVVASGPD